MARCVTCNANLFNVLIGKIQVGDLRYCSVACASKDFFRKLQAALVRAATANPNPLPDSEPTPTEKETGGEDSASPIVLDESNNLAVIGLGLATIAVVTILIHGIHAMVEYPFFAQTVWFVIPIGAFLCGMVAGCGFWLALRRFHRLPTGLTYLAAGLGGAFGYILIFFLMWWQLDIQGVKVRDEVSFLEFIQYVIENQRVRIHRAGNLKGGDNDGIELGKWGYARFAINLAGFALGVVAMVAIAGGKAYCPKCKRYLVTVGKQSRSSSDPEGAGTELHPVLAGIMSGRIQQALDLHAASVHEGKGFLTTTITVEGCPDCGMQLATLTASVQGQQVEDFVFQGKTDRSVRLPG